MLDRGRRVQYDGGRAFLGISVAMGYEWRAPRVRVRMGKCGRVRGCHGEILQLARLPWQRRENMMTDGGAHASIATGGLVWSCGGGGGGAGPSDQ